MPIITKICGLSTKEAVDVSITHGAAYLGFVFFPASPRHVTPAHAAEITRHVTIPKVAVTVSMSDAEFDTLLAEFTPDYLQLHGKESPQRVREIAQRYNIPVIKAISVSTANDIATANHYEDVSFLLFDAKPPKNATLPGGNGVSFDWSILHNATIPRPWFLSGGLSCQNIERAVKETGAAMVDISSGVESSPGVKDLALIEQFLKMTKTL